MSLARRVEVLEAKAAPLLVRARRVAPLPLAHPSDVLAVLAEQANAVRADVTIDAAERARTLGLLSGLALRAMEARDLAERLEAVERVLKLRKDRQREQERTRR